MEHSLGSLIDALGVNASLDEGQHLTDVLVFARVMDVETGHTALALYTSDRTDYITVRGMLAVGTELLDSVPCDDDCED